MNLHDALYALLMVSANNIAMTIANNLGNYLIKAGKREYFSCFDLVRESREANIAAFMQRMRKLVKELGLKECKVANPHGLAGNIASPLDVANIAAECFTIPLFSKISSTRSMTINMRAVDEDGEVRTKCTVV